MYSDASFFNEIGSNKWFLIWQIRQFDNPGKRDFTKKFKMLCFKIYY